uniref:Uncharacterized protein n=1 Tax=Mola mola TaxID=94237 RepID=A0A3Q3VNQ1_MOLML
MSREVPPRFRYQQDHKVLLKRGQPPLSSMLLGGGGGEGGAGAVGGGSNWVSSSSLSSQGADHPNANTIDGIGGASEAEGWDGGGSVAQVKEGTVWGLSNQGDKAGWGRENNSDSSTPVVSQGAWEGSSSEADWGGTVTGASSSNLAIGVGRGEDGSSSSTSSGGSVCIGGGVLKDSVSPKFATMTKAWDNRKGMESGDSAVEEWSGQGEGTADGGPSSSSGGGSIAGSGEESSSRQKQERGSSTHHNSQKTSSADVALLSMLNRSDLDPRVLSNTGWGQTQIRQNVAWDLDSTRGVANRNERDPWDGGSSQLACGPHMSDHTGVPEKEMEGSQGKAGGGWGDFPPQQQGGSGSVQNRGGGNSDEGSSWGNLEEGGSQRSGWGGGDSCGGKSHQDWGSANPHTAAAQIPNSQVAPMEPPNQQQHQSQGQQPQGGPMQGGWNSRSNFGGGGPPSKNQNQSSGWTSGPIPQISGGGGDSLEPSGWEEPSPQSISRKMEIDDGTSAWGDPTRYNSKNVNLWDKKNATPNQSHMFNLTPSPGPGMWGGGTQSVDNGTAAWGQVSDSSTGWGEPDEPGKVSGWGSPSPNSGTKSLESWGGKGEGSVSASRHPSWDEEDDGGGGVWNSTGSQGSNSSFNSGGWGHSHAGKRGNLKSGGDSWMNPVSRQFSNMGLLGDDPSIDKKMEGDKRGISDYNGEMRRGGRGGGYRIPNSKDIGPVDMGPYGEKVMGGHGVFVGSGGGMAPPRGMHQPGMHPVNPSQGLRAQVPHQFLSAQVSGPMLKQMPSPGGVFPPQISPQQLAMLSNIYPQMQQFHLACQLLLQQQQQQQQILQNQRKFPQPQPLRQQPDPQQVNMVMSIGPLLLLPNHIKDTKKEVVRVNPPQLLIVVTILFVIDLKIAIMTLYIIESYQKVFFRLMTEFQPGVPWKGTQSTGDPESDPYMTPGSVLGSPGPLNLNDSDHQLLRDNIGPNPTLNTLLPSPGAWPYSASESPLSNAHSTGKFSEYKHSWPPEPIGRNKLWKTNRNSSQLPRPPPGLTNQKQASPSPWGSGGPRLARNWGGGGINQESRFGPAWNDSVASRGSCWLLLSNLTPQIDGSTLRTICMQHGPLLTFHLGLTQGSALIRYNSRQEAAKAQGALHMCVLGNTTILAEFVSEDEVARYFAHSQAGGAEGAGSGGAVASGTSPGNERAPAGTTSVGNGSGAQGNGLGIFSQWSTNGAGEGGGVSGVESGRSGLWGGMTAAYPSSSLWGAPQMEERHQMDSPAALLPGDLLGGGSDSI